MGGLRFYDGFVGEAASAAFTLFIKDTDAGAIGAKNPVGQIRGQFFIFQTAAATTAERRVR
jgi:hypothetical protein